MHTYKYFPLHVTDPSFLSLVSSWEFQINNMQICQRISSIVSENIQHFSILHPPSTDNNAVRERVSLNLHWNLFDKLIVE